jgi:hypothetical protein
MDFSRKDGMESRRPGGADCKLHTREPTISHLALSFYAALGIGVLISVKVSSMARDDDRFRSRLIVLKPGSGAW